MLVIFQSQPEQAPHLRLVKCFLSIMHTISVLHIAPLSKSCVHTYMYVYMFRLNINLACIDLLIVFEPYSYYKIE